MAQIKCYDPEGNAYMKEPVDVRECIQNCGYSTEPPTKVVTVPVEDPVAVMAAINAAEIAAKVAAAPVAPDPEPAKPWVK